MVQPTSICSITIRNLYPGITTTRCFQLNRNANKNFRFRSSGMSRSVGGHLFTDVSGQLIGAIFRVQAYHEEYYVASQKRAVLEIRSWRRKPEILSKVLQ